MRIIAGKHKGRRVELLDDLGGAIRPTSEFAREAIFNILSHGKWAAEAGFAGKDVLDVFCGSGAFGLEALSRGARSVTFVDQAREAIASVRHNAKRMNETDTIECLQTNATKLGRARKAYGLVFLDPPYFEQLLQPTLLALHQGGWLAEDALIIIEHDMKEQVQLPAPFTVLDQRRYGRAMVELLSVAGEG